MADDTIEQGPSFANYPATMNEIKSDRSHKATDWTPRDALIRMLRDIDSGAIDQSKLTGFVIAFSHSDGGNYWSSSKDLESAVACVEVAKFKMIMSGVFRL